VKPNTSTSHNALFETQDFTHRYQRNCSQRGVATLCRLQLMKTSLLTLALVALFSAPLPALAAGNNQPFRQTTW
jgi:hypothetical protein